MRLHVLSLRCAVTVELLSLLLCMHKPWTTSLGSRVAVYGKCCVGHTQLSAIYRDSTATLKITSGEHHKETSSGREQDHAVSKIIMVCSKHLIAITAPCGHYRSEKGLILVLSLVACSMRLMTVMVLASLTTLLCWNWPLLLRLMLTEDLSAWLSLMILFMEIPNVTSQVTCNQCFPIIETSSMLRTYEHVEILIRTHWIIVVIQWMMIHCCSHWKKNA